MTKAECRLNSRKVFCFVVVAAAGTFGELMENIVLFQPPWIFLGELQHFKSFYKFSLLLIWTALESSRMLILTCMILTV